MENEENLLEDGIEVGEVISIQEEGTEEEKDFRIMFVFDIEDRTYLCLVPVDKKNRKSMKFISFVLMGQKPFHRLILKKNGKMLRLHLKH